MPTAFLSHQPRLFSTRTCSILELNSGDEALYHLGAQLLSDKLAQQRAQGVLPDMSVYQPPVHTRPAKDDEQQQQGGEAEGSGEAEAAAAGSGGASASEDSDAEVSHDEL